MHERNRPNPECVNRLLNKLCRILGFCSLPEDLIERLTFNPPPDVAGFVEAVFTGEGLDAGFRGPIYQQVKDLVNEAYGVKDAHHRRQR